MEHLTKRLDALEKLVLKQHEIIEILIKHGQRVEDGLVHKEMGEEE